MNGESFSFCLRPAGGCLSAASASPSLLQPFGAAPGAAQDSKKQDCLEFCFQRMPKRTQHSLAGWGIQSDRAPLEGQTPLLFVAESIIREAPRLKGSISSDRENQANPTSC